jgi:hypothetical protein
MRRRGLILIVLGAALLTGFTFWRIAWPSRAGSNASLRVVPAASSGVLNSDAGWRYRQVQPHHWRYVMLQH